MPDPDLSPAAECAVRRASLRIQNICLGLLWLGNLALGIFLVVTA